MFASYRVAIGNKEYKVDISENQVLVDGEPVDADLTRLNKQGLFVFKGWDRKREIHISTQGHNRYSVLTSGRYFTAEVEKANGKTRKRSDQPKEGAIIAPMPGMIINILVQEGQNVEKGQTLVVMESMKMQMELRAPVGGKIEKVTASVHAQVEKGTELVRIA